MGPPGKNRTHSFSGCWSELTPLLKMLAGLVVLIPSVLFAISLSSTTYVHHH